MYKVFPSRLEVGVTRAAVQAQELLAWSRLRQSDVILARLRDPIEPLVEITLDLCLRDGGGTFLSGYRPFLADAGAWWLVGHEGSLLFKVASGELIPSLTRPWRAQETPWRGIDAAEVYAGLQIWEPSRGG
ncbi:MAG TPA: hypothetical protein VGC56_00560 [Allosphingosinicella sp.]|jgi:hypothetical protein